MRALLKSLFLIAFAFILLILGGHVYYRTTGDFDTNYLLEAKKGEVGTNLEAPSDVRNILGRPFHYLGQGHQTFAFVSEDGKVVLKLFKKDYLKRSGWQNLFPPVPPFRSFLLHEGRAKDLRREKLLKGYSAAYLHDKKNSGLVYYHPHMTADAKLKVVLMTGFKFKKSLDLNNEVFAIQVKAVTTKEELSHLLSKRDIPKAKKRIHELISLYFSSYRNGIFDHDHNLLDNTGFYEERAIRQDIGKVVYEPQMINRAFVTADLKKIQEERLGSWFRKQFPADAEELIRTMDREIEKGLSSFP